MKKPVFKELDHTADLGFTVTGRTRATLFVRAATALFWMVLPEPLQVAPKSHALRLHLEADTGALLLREWLSELLYAHATKHLIFASFRVERITSTSITATATGIPFTKSMMARATEIKAVTYHGLALERAGSLWHASVVLDT